MPQNRHWTAESNDAFLHKISFDFISQVEKKLEASSFTQAELARRLGVSEGAVSHILNNPQNLTLKTIVTYARALSIKVSIVAYDDGDPHNERGPINSEVFSTCWERAGRPSNFWAMTRTTNVAETTREAGWAYSGECILGITTTQSYGFLSNSPSFVAPRFVFDLAAGQTVNLDELVLNGTTQFIPLPRMIGEQRVGR